ncbi:pH-sensitive chloride channel 2 [Frankliniella fusca]|uniref:PH-sensitive chloride channel 2 n=1 Tax=Frankliniella fusca TaxID=407009 RepID=A0AAE1I013_9NEOP|nr:pH-sensitive chloride channel 2 [Frankliniella fusca]
MELSRRPGPGAAVLLVVVVFLVRTDAQLGDGAVPHNVWTRPAPAGHAMSRVDLVRRLTDPENYNKHIRPLDGEAALNVSARTYIYLAQSIEGRLHLELKLTMKQELGFFDPRLRYAHLSPGTWELSGDADLIRLLWTPHVFLANEQRSTLLGAGPEHDSLVRVRPDGHVTFAIRFTVSVVCEMKVGRFPFDQQECPLLLESWLDDADDLRLHWAGTYGDRLSLDSFSLMGWRTDERLRARINISDPNEEYPEHFGNKYSSLRLTFSLSREYGFFLMDYYLPSVLLVVISWVTFWIDPDVVPARVLLGSSTMLTFITLAVQTDRSLPVSYNKASEIWFVGCCTFIFGSLVEFAFVNTIWRHGQSVELKKVSTKHILRSTLGTPKPPRRRLLPQERYARRRTSSLPDLFKPHEAEAGQDNQQSHHSYYNTIHAGALRPSPLASVCESAETLAADEADDDVDTVSEGGRPALNGRGGGVTFDSAATLAAEEHDKRPGRGRLGPQVAGTRRQSLSASLVRRVQGFSSSGYGRRISVALTPAFTRMSASEVADWIDRRSRVYFPLAYFVFNVAYWTFVIYL